MDTPPAARILETSAAMVEMEVTIDAAPAAVWETLVGRPDAWWIQELRCVPGGSRVVMDARAGGSVVEENDDGESLLWFTVIHVDPGRALNLAGALAPPFGGPANTFLWIRLEEDGAATKVRMTNSLHGHLDGAMLPQVEDGWRMLLEQGLKPVVEGA